MRQRCPAGVPDVTLADEHSGVVDGLGEPSLEDKGLEAPLEEVLDGEGEHVIELVLGLVQEPVAVHAAEKGLALEDAARALLVQGQELTGVLADPRQHILHAPQLPLGPQPVLAHQLQLCIQTLLLERITGLLERLAICKRKNPTEGRKLQSKAQGTAQRETS